jgi:predicted ATPase
VSRSGLPSGTVTFLFTDIEGSTRLLRDLGAAGYDRALAAHRRVLRDAFLRHDGVEVDTQGDAFFVAFPTAAGALKAAAECQHVLASGPIRVRMGLHTGTPFLGVEGYVGADVNLGARIAASGHGGQVLLSRATRELVEDDLQDLGEHRLKDFAEPVWIFQLGSEPFPPLKTISNTNVPRPASSFVGRESELADVLSLLRDGDRVVTLSGPGGSGKTRLAIEAATELVPEFRNGVYWVGLATLRDPTLVVETVAQTVGAEDGLAEHIGDREMLLLLDNFEQVVEAARELSSLLPSCPNLRVLVTSRELLRIQGEREYAVPPLAEQDAVELFCRRSGAEPDETIPDLCSRLDNLPLAVELAAARAGVLSPAQILERLSQRLDLLRGGRDADPRQQTLRATIDWSHSLLEEEERALFARLAVFRGGCTLEAAEEVADATIDALQSLVDRSLVRHTSGRFWLLETIHEYARERLAECGAEAEVRRRHATYFVRFAEEMDQRAEAGNLFAEASARIGGESDNLRTALEWARDLDEDELLLRLVAAIAYYWGMRGLVHEGRSWVAVALQRGTTPPLARVKVLRLASTSAMSTGDLARAEALVAEQRALAEEIGDKDELLSALNSSAHLTRAKGDHDGARTGFLDLREAAAALGRPRMRAYAIVNLGMLEFDAGDYHAALDYSAEAADLLSGIGDDTGLLAAFSNCGWATLCIADPARAEDFFCRALVLAGRLESGLRIAHLALALGAALVAKGEEERGAGLLGAGAALADTLDVPLFNDALEEQIHERAVMDARAALGEEVFAAAWDRGRTMKPDEIVRFCGELG